jgi:putative hydrolase of the HAD superfamily
VIFSAAVVFDLDDTLFDHRASARQGLSTWLAGYGIDVTDELETAWFDAELRHHVAWRNGEVSWAEQRRRRLREFLPIINEPVGSDSKLDDLFTSGFLAAYEAAWRGFDDVPEALADLRTRGFQLAILTNGKEEQQRAKLKRLGLLDTVGPVLTAEKLGVAKPHPKAFEAVCSALDLMAHEVVYVGDDYEVDFVGAKAVGLHAVHLDRSASNLTPGESSIRDLRQLASLVALPEHPGP